MSRYPDEPSDEQSEFQPRRHDPVETYRQAKKNPTEFWRKNLEAIQRGLARPEFVGTSRSAEIALVIPAHNETLGDKDGNLQACLYALSQLSLPEGVKIKIMVIGHNNSREDVSRHLVSQASSKIEFLSYDTPLRGFSYPLQAAALIWTEDEASEIGIIDADTVVNPDWLTAMHQTLAKNQRAGALAGPRRYLDGRGHLMAYGEIKVLMEKTLGKSRAKLVSGNSYYRAGALRQAVANHVGEMMTDGVIQDEISQQSLGVMTVPEATAVSDGEKFAEQSAVATLLQKARIFARPGVRDHINFILYELASYFPDFAERLRSEREFYETESDFNDHDFLRHLQVLLAEHNQSGRTQMTHDLRRLRSQRKKTR